ncbi:alpha/beta fold hydrolase [Brevibacillus fluminis]|nr:alpha/beta hydrolase [Brevibacillus fluminis]
MKRKALQVLKISIRLVLVWIAIGLIFPTWTPRIEGDNSISSLRQVMINGTGHEVMIRGVDRRNPILIFVHGGPGCSEIPYVTKYQDILEQHFTIVHYDQRGSGKSYHFFEDYSHLTTDVLVDDLLALTDYVEGELGQPKVLLIGHSFGTYIGMKAAAKAPSKYAAYIGIGQVGDHVMSETDSLNFVIDQAKNAGNQDDAKLAEQLRESIMQKEASTPRTLIRKYGGAARVIDDNLDYYTGFVFHPEYNLFDVIRYVRGVAVSQPTLLEEEAHANLPQIVRKLDIPAYFVMGQYDFMTSVHAAKVYFEELTAPKKEFVIFPKSAHYPQFEEKEAFAKWLVQTWSELAS